jgi:hypothetical protein
VRVNPIDITTTQAREHENRFGGLEMMHVKGLQGARCATYPKQVVSAAEPKIDDRDSGDPCELRIVTFGAAEAYRGVGTSRRTLMLRELINRALGTTGVALPQHVNDAAAFAHQLIRWVTGVVFVFASFDQPGFLAST